MLLGALELVEAPLLISPLIQPLLQFKNGLRLQVPEELRRRYVINEPVRALRIGRAGIDGSHGASFLRARQGAPGPLLDRLTRFIGRASLPQKRQPRQYDHDDGLAGDSNHDGDCNYRFGGCNVVTALSIDPEIGSA